MSHVREKHNSKARQSTAGSRKKGKLKRKRAEEGGEEPDANALIQQSKTKDEKEIERKERLKQEVDS